MTFRAILVLLGCALAAAHAASDTYQRYQPFKSAPKNWRYFNPNQGFGYFPSSGVNGLAGGFFFPKTYTAYYGDTSLNGAFRRSTPISASGRIRLDEVSFDPNYTNSVYIAHFRKGTTNDMFVNIVGMSLTGTNQGFVNVAPVVQFSDGAAYLGKAISLPVDSKPLDWSYSWTPDAAGGFGQLTLNIGDETTTLTLPNSSEGLDYALDSFGLYQPAFVQPNSNSFFVLFISKPTYTALVGPPPSLRIKGPKKIQTSATRISLAGTAKASLGNSVAAVRYRIVQNGKAGRYKDATGTETWNANVRVPSGSSRVEVTAFGDNGLTKTVKRNVTRTP